MKKLRLSLLGLLILTFTGSLAFAGSVMSFSANIQPPTLQPAEVATLTLTITNSGTSTHDFASATVVIPDGFVLSTSTPIQVNGPMIPQNKKDPLPFAWTATVVGTTIRLGATGEQAGIYRVPAGSSVTVTFTATAPCAPGSYQWITSAYNTTLQDGPATPFTLDGLQPSISVSGASVCSSVAFGPGDYCSYTQGGWGAKPSGGNVAATMASSFTSVYTSGTALKVGTPKSMTFTSANNVKAYLPAGGPPDVLTVNSLINPTSTSSGVFGGQVLALRLNVDFNNAKVIAGTDGSIAGLKLKNTGTSLDGLTVAQILAIAESALGGGALQSGFTVSTLNDIIDLLNKAFDNCAPSDWAQTHLARP